MLRSITKDIQTVANSEVLQDFFTTPEGLIRTVKFIACEVAADIVIRGYVDQDRVIETGMEPEAVQNGFCPDLDIKVDLGRTFKAGLQELAGATPLCQLTVWFEETT